MLESGITFDLAQLVLDNELIAMTKAVRCGVPVNDVTTAIGEIVAAGPGGHFLKSRSTRAQARNQSMPSLIDRRRRDAWEKRVDLEIYERARKEALRILSEHRAAPLPDGAADEIRTIVVAADSRVRR